MSQVAFHCPWLLTPAGWEPNRILSVDREGIIEDIVPAPGPAGTVRLGGPVIPGMVNVHSHAHQRLIAGLTGRRGRGEDSFWSWREAMYRAVAQLTVADLQFLATWLYMELLEGGYTSNGEFHYPHRLQGAEPAATSQALLAAAEQAGCGLTILPVWYQYSGFGRRPPAEHQRPFILDQGPFHDLVEGLLQKCSSSGLQRVGLAPHSLRAVDVDDLKGLTQAFPELPVHIHISEQLSEVDECHSFTGRTPVQLLTGRVKLDSRWCLIHATHATPAEMESIANSGAVVGLCPTTEADLGDGIFPVRDLLKLGGCFAIGSDSNLASSAAGELRLLEWTQRLVSHQRNMLVADGGGHVGRFLWTHAARQGAVAINQPVGELRQGRRADLVVLNELHPLLNGLDPEFQLDTFIMAEQSGMIDRVYVAGQQRVVRGRHLDRDSMDEGFCRLRGRLMELMK
ncbi:MAG: formimidoylglutamate deiminase [Wenzhouxiangella sp.]